VNGAHDMGGVKGFGPVKPEPNEPPFHAEWERRIFALTLAMSTPGGWNLDMSRAARESLPPNEYLSKSYYEIWLFGLQTLMAERGLVTEDELVAGQMLHPPTAVKPPLSPDDIARVVRNGAPTVRESSSPPRYRSGDIVRAKAIEPQSHTRMPGYVRGHIGLVEHVRSCHVFPDSHALGTGEAPEWLYTLRFDGSELWGADADPSVRVLVDLWEPYLEPV
jgi:nitrile hydratase beta subunit